MRDHISEDLIPQHLEEKIHKLREHWDVPGLGVVVVASPEYQHPERAAEEGESGWRTSYLNSGIRSIRGDVVSPDTIWGIASNSKFFTTLAIGMLMHDGITLPSGNKLSWDTTVKEALGWELIDKYTEEHLTLGEMLAMQSGLPRHDMAAQQDTPIEELLKHMAHFRPSAGIRQTWQYNNYVYHIAPLLFTKYSETSFTDFVQKRIFDPLELTSATYNVLAAANTGHYSESFIRKRTKAREEVEDGKSEIPREYYGNYGSAGPWNEERAALGLAGAGGINMNLRDMGKWLQEVLKPRVIPTEVLKQVLMPRMLEATETDHPEIGLSTYCLGHETFSYRGHQVYQHTGGLPALSSYFLRIPDKGVGVFAIANDDDLGRSLGLAVVYFIFDHLLGLSPIDWGGRTLPMALKEGKNRWDEEPVPEKSRPAGEIVGTYHNEAYPQLEIRPIRSEESYLSSRPGFVAELDFYFVTRLVFTHVDGPIWQWRKIRPYPEHRKDGSTGNVPLLYTVGRGTCVLKPDGLGFFADFWGQGAALPKSKPDENDTQAKAEVWYRKV